jgi:predicted methyltransferase MtxX (methanogen marker protein 4)
MKKTVVFCTLQIEGTHNWKDCPFEEVAYLRDTHRHVFWIKAYKEVSHSDRDVEFIMLKHRIEQYLKSKYRNTFLKLCVFGSMSCEMIAEELITAFDLCKCEVNEDNENGAIVIVVPNA